MWSWQINNARVSKRRLEVYEDAVDTVEANYFGTKRVTETLLPLLRASPHGARIVMISSQVGLRKVIYHIIYRVTWIKSLVMQCAMAYSGWISHRIAERCSSAMYLPQAVAHCMQGSRRVTVLHPNSLEMAMRHVWVVPYTSEVAVFSNSSVSTSLGGKSLNPDSPTI